MRHDIHELRHPALSIFPMTHTDRNLTSLVSSLSNCIDNATVADMPRLPQSSGTVSQSLTRVKTGSRSSLISNVSSWLGGTSQAAVLPFLYRTWLQRSPTQDTSSPVSLFREATQQKRVLVHIYCHCYRYYCHCCGFLPPINSHHCHDDDHHHQH